MDFVCNFVILIITLEGFFSQARTNRYNSKFIDVSKTQSTYDVSLSKYKSGPAR